MTNFRKLADRLAKVQNNHYQAVTELQTFQARYDAARDRTYRCREALGREERLGRNNQSRARIRESYPSKRSLLTLIKQVKT